MPPCLTVGWRFLLKMPKDHITYTLILHQIRKELKLTLMEYCVADCVYHLSNNPNSKIQGWCFATKETIANMLGTTAKTIFGTISKLVKKGFIEKDESTKHLKTTSKWYEKVVLIKANAEYNQSLGTITKGYTGLSPKVIPTITKGYTYNNIYKDEDVEKIECG